MNASSMPAGTHADASGQSSPVTVRRVSGSDIGEIIAIDAQITSMEKAEYWYERFHEFGSRDRHNRFFLVAERDARLLGYIIGEVREWEFGTAPCGWVFAIGVRPDARVSGVGAQLFEALCGGFRAVGLHKVRTLLAFDDGLVMSFYRSQGMMAAPIITLERDLDPDDARCG